MPKDRLMGWVMTLVVTAIAAGMRLNRLGLPRSLALPYCAGLALGSRTASIERRFWGAGAVGLYLGLVLWNFYFMYPVLAGKIMPYQDWQSRMWLSSWV